MAEKYFDGYYFSPLSKNFDLDRTHTPDESSSDNIDIDSFLRGYRRWKKTLTKTAEPPFSGDCNEQG
jgi:hypothetical protein